MLIEFPHLTHLTVLKLQSGHESHLEGGRDTASRYGLHFIHERLSAILDNRRPDIATVHFRYRVQDDAARDDHVVVGGKPGQADGALFFAYRR